MASNTCSKQLPTCYDISPFWLWIAMLLANGVVLVALLPMLILLFITVLKCYGKKCNCAECWLLYHNMFTDKVHVWCNQLEIWLREFWGESYWFGLNEKPSSKYPLLQAKPLHKLSSLPPTLYLPQGMVWLLMELLCMSMHLPLITTTDLWTLLLCLISPTNHNPILQCWNVYCFK